MVELLLLYTQNCNNLSDRNTPTIPELKEKIKMWSEAREEESDLVQYNSTLQCVENALQEDGDRRGMSEEFFSVYIGRFIYSIVIIISFTNEYYLTRFLVIENIY